MNTEENNLDPSDNIDFNKTVRETKHWDDDIEDLEEIDGPGTEDPFTEACPKIGFSFKILKQPLEHKEKVEFSNVLWYDKDVLIGSEIFKVWESKNQDSSGKSYEGVVDVTRYKLGLNVFVDMFIETYFQYDVNNQLNLRTIERSFNLEPAVKRLFDQYVTFVVSNDKVGEIQTIGSIVEYENLEDIAINRFYIEEYQKGVTRYVFDKYMYLLGDNPVIDKFLDGHQEFTTFHEKRWVTFTSEIKTNLPKAQRSDFTNVRNVLRTNALNDGGKGFDVSYDFKGQYVYYTFDVLNYRKGADMFIDTFLYLHSEYQLYRETEFNQ